MKRRGAGSKELGAHQVHRDYRALARCAIEQGWRIRYQRSNGHLRWLSPQGSLVTSAATPSDRRSLLNQLSRMKRAGLTWPPAS